MTARTFRTMALGALRAALHRAALREGGQSTPLLALALGMSLVGGALAVDVGLAYGERRELQTGADLSALAGALELPPL